LSAQITLIDRLLPKWLSASRELADALQVVAWRYETASMGVYISSIASEVETAAALTDADLRASIANVLAGHLDIALARPPIADAEPLLPEPVAEKLTQVFSLNALAWTHDGVLRRCSKWVDVELPAACAERALRHAKAVPMSDPRRAELRGHGGGHPDPSWCFDLDREPSVVLPASDDPAEMFTRIDRGPGFKLAIATG
jgi:hypothetical protein